MNNKTNTYYLIIHNQSFAGAFKGIVSRYSEWLQTILMNRLCGPFVPLEVYSFLNSHLHKVFKFLSLQRVKLLRN